MKFRKFILQLGLLLTVVFGVGIFGGESANAEVPQDAPAPPTGAQVLDDSHGCTKYAYTDSKGVFQVPKSAVTLTGTPSNNGWSFSKYPNFVALAANNTSSTNRITDKTTEIYLAVKGSFTTSGTTKITSMVPYITNGNGMTSFASNSSPDLVSTPKQTVTPATTYYKFDVNMSGIINKFPLYVGFKGKTSDKSASAYMGFAVLGPDSSVTDVWQHEANSYIRINGTTHVPATGSMVNIKSSDRVITGIAYPSPEISAEVYYTTVSGVKRFPVTVNADKTYSFDFGAPIGNLASNSVVSFDEYNDMGDIAYASAQFKQVLDLDVAKTPLNIYPDDVHDLSGKTDQQVLDWLVKAAGITVTHNEAPVNISDVTFNSTESGLANQIANLKDGESTTIDVGAALTATPSTATDTTKPVRIVNHEGTLSFQSISPTMDFGTVAVPSKETLFAPTTMPEVFVEDTQLSGTPWYVTASASDLESADNRKLNGHMVYVDANGGKQSMASAVQIAAGQSTRDMKDGMNVVTGWSKENQQLGNPANGMYLDALPSIYSGDKGTTYTGTISWSLTNAPGSVGTGDSGDLGDGSVSTSSSSADSSSEEETNSSSESESGGDQSIPGGSTVGSSGTPVYNAFG
ncbi:hypothetical protein [Levilactobacillus andaensis]|uniref:hypothetical protein n=1 Tax=Levilactobacillus andaensis TaxID=2799570 RepID=UPI0019444CF8|nr:hypothetical protein [Levilactobacillus andaensis]